MELDGVIQPTEVQIDEDRESKLMHKLDTSMEKLKNSIFYELFQDQLQNSGVLDCLYRVMESDWEMQMVIYGIGKIESDEDSRMQLSLALLMKEEFDWISEIQVFDPVLSRTERRVLEALGCSVLDVNEECRREACKPTLFFMPHCDVKLYNNLIEANWRADRLRNIALFGNSFKGYDEFVSFIKENFLSDGQFPDGFKYILSARRFEQEFGIQVGFSAFRDCCWQFFRPPPDQGPIQNGAWKSHLD